MKGKKFLIGALIAMSFGVVGCGAENEGPKEEPKAQEQNVELNEDSVEVTTEVTDGDFFVGVKSSHPEKLDLVLKEDDKVVFEGELNKSDEATKIYNLTNNGPDKDCEYELVVSDGETSVIKVFDSNDVLKLEQPVEEDAIDKDDVDEDSEEKDDNNEEQVNLDDVLDEYEEWDDDSIKYEKGDEVEYKGRLYECLQPHTSQTAWNPKEAVSLWQEFKI